MPEVSQTPPSQSSNNPDQTQSTDASYQEPVWTFRGYQLKSSEFTTAMVHYFRAEISRSNVWRQRLDSTTNWAVITTGAALTIAFNPEGFHAVIILNTLLVTLFLLIEARRYRYYELWSYRVRLLETDFFAAMLVPPFHPGPDWAESLAENLLHPDFSISMWEAIGRRFRRNYLWIYLVLGLTWIAKVSLFPGTAATLEEFYNNAAIGAIPGWLVFFAGVIFYAGMMLFGALTSTLHQATGEVLPRYGVDLRGIPWDNGKQTKDRRERPWFRLSRRRQQLMALIITQNGPQVATLLLKEMLRGVTSMQGKGMYSGQERSILLCALTATEVAQLKSLVHQIDPAAFVIVMPAQEVLGKGFIPLHTD